MEKAQVYFTEEISPEILVKIYKALGVKLREKTAVKLSTGEPGGHNFLQPEMIKDLITEVNGTIVECNTAYGGPRSTTESHWRVMKQHGFMDIAPCDIMDGENEIALPVYGGKHLKNNYVGANLQTLCIRRLHKFPLPRFFHCLHKAMMLNSQLQHGYLQPCLSALRGISAFLRFRPDKRHRML